RGLRRPPHRNGRSAAQPRPSPPIVRCFTRATWRTKLRDSNCRWMNIQWQVRSSGRYFLTGKGDINTYALFAELFLKLVRPTGRAGMLVPTGIATDSTNSEFFGELVNKQRLSSLYSFYEIRGWFKGTDDRKSFCILTIGATSG